MEKLSYWTEMKERERLRGIEGERDIKMREKDKERERARE